MERPTESKKRITLAVAGSILFHLLLFVFLIFWLEVKASQPIVRPPVQPDVLELTIIPPPPPEDRLAEAPTPEEERPIIRSDNLTETDETPENTVADSDRDTLAGGNRPATGPDNLPSIDGRESGSDVNVSNQEYSLGGDSTLPGSQAPRNATTQATPAPTPEAIPEATPAPTPIAKNESVTPKMTLPAQIPDDALALGQPTPTPPPLPEVPALAPPGGQAYRSQTRATRMEGSLSNNRRPSIATRGTPLGRYLRKVENAIGSRWYFYIKRDRDLIASGSVRLIFTIDRNGKIGNLRILANTSNEGLASTSTQSILDAELPPIPDEVASTLFTQRLELPFTFTIY